MLSEAMAQPFYRWDAPTRRQHEQEMRDVAKTFAHNLCLLDRFGMDDLRSFIATVKHYVLNEECKVVFLDHFSLLADGIDLRADQRRTIDKAIAELKTIAMDLGFCFVIVSHLSRDTGMGKAFEEGGEPSLSHLRGSASLGQIPSYIWMLQRNPMEESNNNETKCFLKKNRETGEVGMKSTIHFQPDIYRLTEVN
jgi:twinkle protein